MKPAKIAACILLGMINAHQAKAAAQGEAFTFDPSLFLGSGFGEGIERFNQENAVVAGRYSVDIWLNNQFVQQDEIPFRALPSGEVVPCLSAAFWQNQGVSLKPETDAQCLYPQAVVEGARWELATAELKLSLYVPQAALRKGPADAVPASQWNAGESVLFTNYNANFYSSSGNGSRSDYGWLGLNSGINLGLWQFRQQSSASISRFNDRQTQKWDNLQTWVQRPIAALGSTLTLGESYTAGNLLGSVAFTGVKLQTDERMQPQSRRGYAPEIRGTATSPARVVVSQNGRKIYETSVPEGPFLIDTLANSAWEGDLQVDVIEAQGKRSQFTVPFASVPLSMRPGTWRYSSVLGAARDYPQVNNRFADFTLEHGWSNTLTLNSAARVGEKYQALVVGGVVATRFGAFGSDVTASRASIAGQTEQGWRWQTNWSRTFAPTGTHVALAGYRYSTAGYRDFSDVLAQRRWQHDASWRSDTLNQRNQFTATLNQSLGELGNLWFSGSTMDYYDNRGRSTQLQMGYSTQIGRANLNFTVSRQQSWWMMRSGDTRARQRDGQKENLFTLTLSLPLSMGQHDHYVSWSASRGQQAGAASQLSLTGPLDKQETLSYAVSAGWQQGKDGNAAQNNWSATLQKMSNFGTLNGSYARASNYQQWSGGVRGAVVLHGGGLTAGPWLGETFALIEADGAQGARVSSTQNAVVDGNGYALVPSLTPYRYNTISLDSQALDNQTELQESQQRIAPWAGAAVKLKFATLQGHALLISLKPQSAQGITLGAEVKDSQGAIVGMVGQGLQAYARVTQPQGRISIERDGGQPCLVTYRLVPAQINQPLIPLTGACESP